VRLAPTTKLSHFKRLSNGLFVLCGEMIDTFTNSTTKFYEIVL